MEFLPCVSLLLYSQRPEPTSQYGPPFNVLPQVGPSLLFFFLIYFYFFLYWCNMGNLIDRSLFLLVTCRLIDNDGEGGEVTDGLYIKSKLNDPSRGIYFHSGLPVTRIPDDALSCGLHSTCICTFLRVWTCFIQINKLIILVIRF